MRRDGPPFAGWDPKDVLRLARQIAHPPRPIEWFPGWQFGFSAETADDAGRLRQEVWRYFHRAGRDAAIIVEWCKGIRVRAFLGSDLGWALFVDGCFEPNQFALLKSVLVPGMTFLDVGANEGLYSLFASRQVGRQGTVLALEPSRREYGRLRRNLRLNRVSNVRTLRAAAYDADGEATLLVAEPAHAGHNTLGRFVYETEKLAEEPTTTVRLDTAIRRRRIERVDVMKIDTEGAESAVLRGAIGAVQRDHPVLLVEASDQQLKTQGSNLGDLLHTVSSWGYQIYAFDDASGRPMPADRPTERDPNILALHPQGPKVTRRFT